MGTGGTGVWGDVPMRMTPEQLSAMLSGGMVPGTAAASADNTEQEDNAHEE